MLNARRVAYVSGVAALALLTVVNIFLFVTTFPRAVLATASSPILEHLPFSEDVSRPPEPPLFLSRLSAKSIYVSSEVPHPRLLLAEQADSSFPLASLTKLITALVALDHHPKWEDEVAIQESDLRGGAKTPLAVGKTVTVNDLWSMSLVASDNDATAALARSVIPDEKTFVEEMNAKTKALGLEHALFVEPTGLSPKNVASARDVASLARVAFMNERIRSTLAEPETTVMVSGKETRIQSSDQRVKVHTAGAENWTYRSGKTGFVDESGYNVVALGRATTGQNLIVVLLGSSSASNRASEADELFAWAAQVLKSDSAVAE